MLPGATVPRSLADLLAVFRPCFTAPTFQTFIGLVVGENDNPIWPHRDDLIWPHPARAGTAADHCV
jgi:hypothetical protein